MGRKNTSVEETEEIPAESTDEATKREMRSTNVAGMQVSTTNDSLDRLAWGAIISLRAAGQFVAELSDEETEAKELAVSSLNALAANIGADVRIKGRSVVLEFAGPTMYRRVIKVIRANDKGLEAATRTGSFGDMKLLSFPHAGVEVEVPVIEGSTPAENEAEVAEA